ncbi:MAG: gliding motility lipoprotein GldH [Verrucomicrobia bacterium]|nr:gliding motility lipoprotein GldH [Cytophagales bacterium]
MRLLKKYNFLLFLLLLSACDKTRVYEAYYDIPNGLWAIKNVQQFSFSIQDTTQKYTIYYNVRNDAAYGYHNLYVTYYLKDSQGKQLSSRLQELKILDSKTGKPLGSGLGDLFDHRVVCMSGVKFPKAGAYTFAVKQYMRQDPLPHILSVGMRVAREE